MIAKLIKIKRKPSKYGGYFYYAFFKEKNTDKSYYTCLYPKMRNFTRWKKVMREGVVLKGLKILKNRLIDADSKFSIVKG